MPDGNVNIHASGSWLGDASEEFKKLPTWGKLAVGVALLIVVFIAIYEVRKNAGASATVSPMGAANQTGATQSPFPSINGQPLLPSGVNPLYSPGGDVVGYQQSPVATPTPTPTTPGGGLPTISSWLGNIPNFSKVIEGGSDTNGQRYWFTPPGGSGQKTLFYLPVGSQVYAGGDGRWWYKVPGGQQTALTNNGKFAQPMVMSNNASTPTPAPAIPKVS